MEQRSLGRTGITVSAVGLGCGAVGGLFVRGSEADQRRGFDMALAAGVTYFDTAQSYGDGASETNLGRVWREVNPANATLGTKVNLRREEVAGAPAAIRRSLEASLRRLGRDSVDVFHLHNRVVEGPAATDRAVTVDEVLGPIADGLRAVRDAGLTRFVGFTGLGETAAVLRVAQSGLVDTAQCYFNVLNPSGGSAATAGSAGDGQDFGRLIERAAAGGVGTIGIRILAAGALSASAERHPIAGNPGGALGGSDYAGDVERAASLAPVAAELGFEGPLELALRYALAEPNLSTALVGVADTAQLESLLRWAARGPLGADTLRAIRA